MSSDEGFASSTAEGILWVGAGEDLDRACWRKLFFDKKTSASTFPCDRKHRLFTINPDTENTCSANTAVPGTGNISQEVGPSLHSKLRPVATRTEGQRHLSLHPR